MTPARRLGPAATAAGSADGEPRVTLRPSIEPFAGREAVHDAESLLRKGRRHDRSLRDP